MAVKKGTKRAMLFLCVLIFALGTAWPVMASNPFIIPVDLLDMARLEDAAYVSTHLTAATQYIRLTAVLFGDPAPAHLTITRTDTGEIVYEKSYGDVSGMFSTDDIYLQFSGNTTIPYHIELELGEETYSFPFYRKLMPLLKNSACTFGIRLSEADRFLNKNWIMGTVLDLEEIENMPGSSMQIPLCGSNTYEMGTVTVRVREGTVRVSMQFVNENDVDIHDITLFLMNDVSSLESTNPNEMEQPVYQLGKSISIEDELNGARYVLLYLPMTVSYDPNGLNIITYDMEYDEWLQNQRQLWNQLAQQGTGEAQ